MTVKIQIVDVSKRFGPIVAVNRVSLEVLEGEILTIIGPSGCGKSTLLKMIAGVLRPDSGDIRIDGRSVVDVPMEQRRIAFVFQNILLFPHMTVGENVRYSPVVRGVEKSRAEQLVATIRDFLRLRVREYAYPRELSMGMQQKVALARALAAECPIMLLDEPLSALDAIVRARLRYELRRIIKDLQLTAIYVTHDQAEAMTVADRIAVMRKGQIIQVGTPEELYNRPMHPFVARFLGGEANFIEGVVREVVEDRLLVEAPPFSELQVVNPGLEVKPGSKVILAIKPEDLILGRGVVEGEVSLTSYLGDSARIEIEVNGFRFVYRGPTEMYTQLSEGDKIRIDVVRERVMVMKYPEEGLLEAISIE
ncbi:ABC transporter ATP-binding protein [archaeon]|nr:ABC transporter ATP-binding protein [archaeon]